MKPYKQTTAQSCLAVCLLQSIGINPTPILERKLLYKGLDDVNNYVMGVLNVFVQQHNINCIVYVDNNFYRNFLESQYKNSSISFIHKQISDKFLNTVELPCILQITTHTLGTWDYSPHFISIESRTKHFMHILDPLSVKKIRMSKEKIDESIQTLKQRMHYCPLVIKTIERL